MLNKICILDTETTGLDPKKGKLIEVACILYDVPSRSIQHQLSTLLYAEENPVEHINGISVESLKRISDIIHDSSIKLILSILECSDLFIAHNAKFDKEWLSSNILFQNSLIDKKWLCTRCDIKWPKTDNLKLSTIAEKMEVINNSAHRALSDCQTLLQCLLKLEDFEQQLHLKYEKMN